MQPLSGSTRSTVTSRYALLTPAGFVSSLLPGWDTAACYMLVAPQLGARFWQHLVTLGRDGTGQGTTGERELFVFVISGNITLQYTNQLSGDTSQHLLKVGGYGYIGPGYHYAVQSNSDEVGLLLFERDYAPLPQQPPPAPLVGHEQQVEGEPFLGDEDALLKTLLPDEPAFDMAVNIFTFQPGATLPMVETHIMEHGLLMLQGQGIYRLDTDWHLVQAGDVIWMAPYCPQWFAATGKTPARYIYYKDVNRV